MGIEIDPGIYTFQFIAHWLTEIEYAGLTPAQAEFWTQSDREECIGYITVDAEEIMQNWDEGRHGQAPQEGDPEYIELLEPYECEHVYQDITLSLPCKLGGKVELEDCTPLLELIRSAGHEEVLGDEGWPDDCPCSCTATTGWKCNDGTCEVELTERTTFAELLQTISGDLWLDHDGTLAGSSLEIVDQPVEFECGRSKCFDLEVLGP